MKSSLTFAFQPENMAAVAASLSAGRWDRPAYCPNVNPIRTYERHKLVPPSNLKGTELCCKEGMNT